MRLTIFLRKVSLLSLQRYVYMYMYNNDTYKNSSFNCGIYTCMHHPEAKANFTKGHASGPDTDRLTSPSFLSLSLSLFGCLLRFRDGCRKYYDVTIYKRIYYTQYNISMQADARV